MAERRCGREEAEAGGDGRGRIVRGCGASVPAGMDCVWLRCRCVHICACCVDPKISEVCTKAT